MNLYYKFILRETKMADFERRQLEIPPRIRALKLRRT